VVPTESFAAVADPDRRQRAIVLLQQKAQSLAAEVAERRHAQESLQSLFRISQKLHTTLDLDTLLTQLVEESLRLVGAEGGYAGLRGPDGMASHSYVRTQGASPLESCWQPGHGLPGWLVEHRRPYLTNDALHDPQIERERCRQLGIWSALSVPIPDADGEVLGFLELHNRRDGRGFTEADVEKVVTVSQIASVALQNARSYREAQNAIRLRDELLSIASHELRTPLTTVSAHAQLMLRRLARDGGADPATVERAFGTIVQQSSKLTRLIEQLLDVSRLEAGRVTLARQRTDVTDLVQRVIGAAEVRTQQRIVALVPAGVWAWVDPLRLDQMVTNLLDNAIKYGAPDQPIEIALGGPAGEPPGQIEISVRDYGPGIPAESRPRLFERFFQAHAEGYKSGMGLGLFISRQIAELHGGQIEAELPPDGGTRFVIRLPAAPDAASDSASAS
jgi:signal transduction histidine kinase